MSYEDKKMMKEKIHFLIDPEKPKMMKKAKDDEEQKSLENQSLESQKEFCFLYQGKAKKMYEVKEDSNLVLIEFTDHLTAFDAKKRGQMLGKGRINRNISSVLFRYLKKQGVSNHWVSDVGENSMLCQRVRILPLEVVIRNRWSGFTARKLGLKEGQTLHRPLLEFYYKDDSLGDPFINDDQVLGLNIVQGQKELEEIRRLSFLINEKLKLFFKRIEIELIDFKIEFGQLLKKEALSPEVSSQGSLSQDSQEPLFSQGHFSHQAFQSSFLLSDEISPDTCRLWDRESGKKLDKDRYRYDMGQIRESYEEVERRVRGEESRGQGAGL